MKMKTYMKIFVRKNQSCMSMDSQQGQKGGMTEKSNAEKEICLPFICSVKRRMRIYLINFY